MRYKVVVLHQVWDEEEYVDASRTIYIEAEDSKQAEFRATAFGRSQYEEDFVGVESVSEVKV